jgi:hypothetical protein
MSCVVCTAEEEKAPGSVAMMALLALLLNAGFDLHEVRDGLCCQHHERVMRKRNVADNQEA